MISLLPCKCCGKSCVGQTTDNLGYRWNNYKDNNNKHSCNEICIQEHLFKHFNNMRHSDFLSNVSIAHIDNTDGKNPKNTGLLEENF